jgi:AcrR family transcriptional regulator
VSRRAQPSLESVARPTRQARSEATLHRLLDATEELIGEKGLADTSVPEIVRRAGSSVGGFYARFRDKDELLRALEERFFIELSQHVEVLLAPDGWRGAGLPEVIHACVSELVRIYRQRAPMIAAFLTRAAQDPDSQRDGLHFQRGVSTRMTTLLLARRHEIRHPDPELAIDLGVQAAFSLMSQKLLFGDVCAGGRSLSDEDLVEQMTLNFLAYLGTPAPRRS